MIYSKSSNIDIVNIYVLYPWYTNIYYFARIFQSTRIGVVQGTAKPHGK